jgi:putative toxin-antitoxin system antitoxin component (TIGR02293 family)
MSEAVASVLTGRIVDTADVARVLGSSLRSVQRWNSGKAMPRKDTEERALELASVLDLAAQVMPEEGARLWLRKPNADLAWRKPLDVVKEGGYREVIDALLARTEGTRSKAPRHRPPSRRRSPEVPRQTRPGQSG